MSWISVLRLDMTIPAIFIVSSKSSLGGRLENTGWRKVNKKRINAYNIKRIVDVRKSVRYNTSDI